MPKDSTKPKVRPALLFIMAFFPCVWGMVSCTYVHVMCSSSSSPHRRQPLISHNPPPALNLSPPPPLSIHPLTQTHTDTHIYSARRQRRPKKPHAQQRRRKIKMPRSALSPRTCSSRRTGARGSRARTPMRASGK
jgi:hypothetical protein